MQPTDRNLFPTVQTRQGNQVRYPNRNSHITTFPPYVQQVNDVGQQVFSMPPSLPPSYQSFPVVVRTPPPSNFPLIQSSFYGVQQWTQPTNHNVQRMTPQILNQDPNQKPLFQASKDRK